MANLNIECSFFFVKNSWICCLKRQILSVCCVLLDKVFCLHCIFPCSLYVTVTCCCATPPGAHKSLLGKKLFDTTLPKLVRPSHNLELYSGLSLLFLCSAHAQETKNREELWAEEKASIAEKTLEKIFRSCRETTRKNKFWAIHCIPNKRFRDCKKDVEGMYLLNI